MLFIFHLRELLFIVLIFLGVWERKQGQGELFYPLQCVGKLNPEGMEYLGWVAITEQKSYKEIKI